MDTKNIEANIGFAGIIIALSPFADNFKRINLSSLYTFKITAFHLYFAFSCILVSFILLQLYFDIFYSKTPNSLRRYKYVKFLNFFYFITITFIPLLTINLIICELFFDSNGVEKISISFFAFLLVAYFLNIYNSQYYQRFQDFEKNEALKNEIQRDMNLSSFLLQTNDIKRLAILHHDIAKRYLLQISKVPYDNIYDYSITDCIVTAWKKNKISDDQKKQYEIIARLWDYSNLDSDEKIKKESLFLNNLFLEHEIKSL